MTQSQPGTTETQEAVAPRNTDLAATAWGECQIRLPGYAAGARGFGSGELGD